MAEETKAMTVIRIINNMMMALGIVLLSQGVYVNITYTTLLVDLTVCLYVVAMHFVLLRLRTFFPFLAAGLGLLAILYLILMPGIKEGNNDYLPVLVVASITFAMTFYAHINESQMIKPSYLLLIYCAFYLLLATYLLNLVPLLFGEVYTICIIELSFVYSVLGRQDRRLRLSSDRTYVPVERIRSSNFLLMSIGSGIIFFFGMIFSVIGHGKKIIEAIWNMILSFLNYKSMCKNRNCKFFNIFRNHIVPSSYICKSLCTAKKSNTSSWAYSCNNIRSGAGSFNYICYI